MSTDALKDREHAEWLANIFKEVDWLIPAYLAMGFLSGFAQQISQTEPSARIDVVRQVLGNVYDEKYLAVMFLERYSQIVYVRDFKRQIDESIRAYFSGYKIVAIVAMVPVIEGIVRKIAAKQKRDVGSGTKRLILEFDTIVERERTSPHCYGERLVMLESLRDFIRDRFLENTQDYDGLNEFNRHGIVHGIFEKYGDDINFFRIITLMDLLCFSIGMMEGGISVFAPTDTAASLALANHFAKLRRLLGNVHLN